MRRSRSSRTTTHSLRPAQLRDPLERSAPCRPRCHRVLHIGQHRVAAVPRHRAPASSSPCTARRSAGAYASMQCEQRTRTMRPRVANHASRSAAEHQPPIARYDTWHAPQYSISSASATLSSASAPNVAVHAPSAPAQSAGGAQRPATDDGRSTRRLRAAGAPRQSCMRS